MRKSRKSRKLGMVKWPLTDHVRKQPVACGAKTSTGELRNAV